MAKISIAINDDDLRWLRQRARSFHGGNLSAAVAEGTRLIRHNEALGELLDSLGAPILADEDRAALDLELDGKAPPRSAKRRRKKA